MLLWYLLASPFRRRGLFRPRAQPLPRGADSSRILVNILFEVRQHAGRIVPPRSGDLRRLCRGSLDDLLRLPVARLTTSSFETSNAACSLASSSRRWRSASALSRICSRSCATRLAA